MNQTELVAVVSRDTGKPQNVVSSALDTFFVTIAESLHAGEKIQIPGWLSFDTTITAARTCRNPRTGESINILAGRRVKVSVGSKLKSAANSNGAEYA